MHPTLYFLRSSESKIVKDFAPLAHPTLDNNTMYYDLYGLSSKDLGLYALVENKIAGAIWSRKLNNEETPTLSLAVLKEFQGEEIASAMMEQFLLEASAVEGLLKVDSYNKQEKINFYVKFGFELQENSSMMFKTLEEKELVRPTDGYNPSRWMD